MRWAKTRPRVTYDLASSGLMPVTTRELLGDATAAAAFDISGPADEGFVPLREAIASRYGTTSERVSIAAGASGANFQAMLALLEPGDDALIETPAYDPLIAAARAAGANVVHFERSRSKGFALDPYVVRTALTPSTKLIVMSNAHNPSGAMASRDTLEQVGVMAEAIGARVLVDEVYAEAQYDEEPPPRPAANLGEVFVTTSSLTKAYGLAGLRCGWIIASAAGVGARARDSRCDRRQRTLRGRAAFPHGLRADRPAEVTRATDTGREPVHRARDGPIPSAARVARARRRNHRLPARQGRRRHERSRRAPDSAITTPSSFPATSSRRRNTSGSRSAGARRCFAKPSDVSISRSVRNRRDTARRRERGEVFLVASVRPSRHRLIADKSNGGQGGAPEGVQRMCRRVRFDRRAESEPREIPRRDSSRRRDAGITNSVRAKCDNVNSS